MTANTTFDFQDGLDHEAAFTTRAGPGGFNRLLRDRHHFGDVFRIERVRRMFDDRAALRRSTSTIPCSSAGPAATCMATCTSTAGPASKGAKQPCHVRVQQDELCASGFEVFAAEGRARNP